MEKEIYFARKRKVSNKYYEGNVPEYNGIKNDVDKELEEYTLQQIEKFDEKWNNYEIANSIQEIWNLISRTNKYIDETMPWKLAKENEDEKLKSCMYHLIENLRKIAILISPFMHNSAENIFMQIGIKEKFMKDWKNLKLYDKIEKVKVIQKGEPIFMRLNSEEEVEFLKNIMKK